MTQKAFQRLVIRALWAILFAILRMKGNIVAPSTRADSNQRRMG